MHAHRYRITVNGALGRVSGQVFDDFVVAAQKEARNLNHHDIGTGVLLLALTGEGTATSDRALASLGITEEAAGQQVREIAEHARGAGGEPRSARRIVR